MTLAVLFALKGVGDPAFYRWIDRDWRSLFPKLPERPRLFRLFHTYADWTDYFLAQATVLGVTDSYGIELLHPYRQGRSPKQMSKKGFPNPRWIVGGKLGCVLNQFGLITAWDCATANVYDTVFHPLIRKFENQMLVLADHGFFFKQDNPSNLKICPCRSWNVRMIVETVLSMLTDVCHFKHVAHRVWAYFQARLAFIVAAFILLVQ